MKFLILKIPPLIVFLLALGMAYALAKLPITQLSFNFPDALAGLLLVSGALSAFLGLWQFRQARTTTNPIAPQKATTLVQLGVFRFTRNPMYLGMVLVLIGGIFKFASLLSFIAVPAFIAYMTQFQIKPEERIMTKVFGQAYRDYTQRVRRWL